MAQDSYNAEQPQPESPEIQKPTDSTPETEPYITHEQNNASPEADLIIKGAKRYDEYAKLMPQLEKGDNNLDLSPPWDAIEKRFKEYKRKVDTLKSMAQERGIDLSDHEALGNILFKNLSKDGAKPTDTVQAEITDSYIVLIASSPEDYAVLSHDETIKSDGAYRRVNYSINPKNRFDTVQGVPTIIVKKSSPPSIIEHEINHHRITTYIETVFPEHDARKKTAGSNASHALSQFVKGGIDQNTFEKQLDRFAQAMAMRALEEKSVAMLTNNDLDHRRPYADDYFDSIPPVSLSEEQRNTDPYAHATSIIKERKLAFEQQISDIDSHLGKAKTALDVLEKSTDAENLYTDNKAVIGTLAMSMLEAHSTSIENLKQGLDFITEVAHLYDPQQTITDALSEYDENLSMKIHKSLLHDYRIEHIDCIDENQEQLYRQIPEHYGYTNARANGKSIADSLRVADTRHQEYLNKHKPEFQRRLREFNDDFLARSALAQAKEEQEATNPIQQTDNTQMPNGAVKQREKQSILGKVFSNIFRSS